MSSDKHQHADLLANPLSLESFSKKLKEVEKKLVELNVVDGNSPDFRSMHDFAMDYAKEGFLIIPLHHPSKQGCSCRNSSCSSIGKHPLTRHGLKDASNKLDQITKWWDQFPIANIGLLTGTDNKMVVLDVDKDSMGFQLVGSYRRTFWATTEKQKSP